MIENTVSFGMIYIMIGMLVMSRQNWTNKSNPFIQEYIAGVMILLLWPVNMIMSNRT
jgi:hypothetical protein